MVLNINKHNQIFTVSGVLNGVSSSKFIETFHKAFLDHDSLEIHVDHLKITDREGVNALAKLHNEALALGKKLKIIGLVKPAATLGSRHDAA
ncbi:MAG: hypothetical protein HKO90_10935 [Flavobacteriaceae bacterium]|nr:hypothetical protein [Bacteroidia bacterium]NNK88788.1 hypothetical protein [Flavobacteriaceae bacterium]